MSSTASGSVEFKIQCFSLVKYLLSVNGALHFFQKDVDSEHNPLYCVQKHNCICSITGHHFLGDRVDLASLSKIFRNTLISHSNPLFDVLFQYDPGLCESILQLEISTGRL